MVIAQHKPPTEVTYQRRPVTDELQRYLDSADAALPAEVRGSFPVVPRAAIEEQYPDHWIALLPTHVDDRNRLIAGRLVARARDWAALDAEVRSFRQAYPKILPFIDYTGRYPMGENVVHV